MNPYAFTRGWHLPTAYPDGNSCERNYPTMYPTSWTSSYFSPSSVYPFQTDSAAAASAVAKHNSNANDWKLQGICSPTPENTGGGVNVRGENGLVPKSGYEGLLYKSNATASAVSARTVAEFEGAAAAAREEAQRSCCAISCSCSSASQGSRLNGMLDTSCAWRPDMSPALDFNKNPNISPYPSLCQRGDNTSCHQGCHVPMEVPDSPSDDPTT
ncbi:hypothetical protein ACOMHN_016959 [Nucella lapillus]